MLSNVLADVSISIDENIEQNTNIITDKTYLKDVYIKLEYVDIDKNNYNELIELNFEQLFANDKLFY